MATWDETKSNGSTYTPEEYNDLVTFAKGVSESATFVVAASDSLDTEHADYVCDGTDDQVEINAAIAALPTAGGRVLLLEGTFNITGQIQPKANTTLMGQGQGTILKAASTISSSLYMIYINQVDHVEISRMQFDGNDTSGHGQEVIGVFVKNDSDYLLINHCYFYRMKDSVSEDGYGSNDYFWIDHCVIDDISDDGIDFNYANCGMITNCIITNCGDNGIDTERSMRVIISNNVIENCGGHGIEWESETYYASARGVIANNTIRNVSGDGIECNSGQEVTIANNNLYEISTHGIYIGKVAYVGTEDQRYGGRTIIIGNYFDEIGGDGVKEEEDAGVDKTFPSLVIGNYFRNVTGTVLNLTNDSTVACSNMGGDPYNYPLADAVSNVTEDSPANGELLTYVTDHWENRTPAEAGLFKAENLASISDVNTGTSTSKAVTPDALAGSNYGMEVAEIAITLPEGPLETGDTQGLYAVPPKINGWKLVYAGAVVDTASSSGSVTVQVHNDTDGVDMLSTAITISAGNKTGTGTVNASNSEVATLDRLSIDVDGAGTSTKGLVVVLQFQAP
jgi:hypothetical protein